MINEENLTALEREAVENLKGLAIPDPDSQYTFQGIKVHEVFGPCGEALLMAFGLIPLARWLEVVNEYHDQHAETPQWAEPIPWDPEDREKVVNALNRVHYERLSITVHGDPQPGEAPFTVHWDTEGITPMTTWVIQRSPRDV